MEFIVRKTISFFLKIWYRTKRPEMVQYWKKSGAALARVVHDKDGSVKMEIKGEKYLYPGFPRGHVLMGPLAKIKQTIKEAAFNQIFAEMEKYSSDIIPPEKMVPAVRELYHGLEELENAEVVPDMKERIKLIRRVICFFLQEDDAYRFRWQWLMERLATRKSMKNIRLSDADLYYFRGKYFKPDIKKTVLGIDIPAHEY